MATISPAYGDKVLDFLFRRTDQSAPTALSLSFHTADPGTTGANEVSTSGTGYARVVVSTSFGAAASANAIANSVAITQAAPSTASYTITHWGLWDQAGAFILGGTVTPNVAVISGNIPQIPIGSITESIA